MSSRSERVVVVGAGPVGLCLVALLARLGVPCVLLEAGGRLENRAGSRAICIQRDVLEILERIGCGREVVAAGQIVRRGRTYFGKRELFATELGIDPSALFPPYVSYPQAALEERILACVEAAAAAGAVELRWSHSVEAVESIESVEGVDRDGGGVRVRARGPSGEVATFEGSYVVGCDGARSTVRAQAGIALEGYTHSDSFLIADVRARVPYPEGERHFFFSPPFNRGRQVLMFPQPGGVWRIDWQVSDELGDAAAEKGSGRLDDRMRALAGHTDYELVWSSAYRFQQRVAARFRSGRVLLAGDAAHLMAPFGARGMNSGIADAENLAWKLAWVLRGDASPALLDTYDTERRAAARHNVDTVGRSLRFMAPPSRRERLVRDATLHASRFWASARRRVDGGRMYEPFTYRDGALGGAASDTSAPHVGALASDARCTSFATGGGRRSVRLRELFGRSFVALYLPAHPSGPAGLASAAAFAASLHASRTAPRTSPRIDAYVVLASGVVPVDHEAGGSLLVDESGALLARYGDVRGGVLLVRPDGHIAALQRGTAEECAAAIESLARLGVEPPRNAQRDRPAVIGPACLDP